MTTLPDFLIQGDKARLIPIVADTSREGRATTVFLAMMTLIPALASDMLRSVGVRVGKRTRIETFTEVVFASGTEGKDRPDGLLVVTNGKSIWTALLELKIANGEVETDQVSRYLEIARANGIDAVITVSNQFVARADHPPVRVNKTLLRKTSLFHWPWMWILTKCRLIELESLVDDSEQSALLAEFVRFLEHPSTGVQGFTQMGKDWRDLVRAVGAGEKIRKNTDEVEDVVAGWLEEQRDLCLRLSSHVGKPVKLKLDRSQASDPLARLRTCMAEFADSNVLEVVLQVPDAASDIEVVADLVRKSICVSMRLRAPQDRKSTKARVNWLLRQLSKADPRLSVRAHWPGRAAPTQRPLEVLEAQPEAIQTDNPSITPHSFEVLLVEELGGRFAGRRTFIEDIERIVPEFYDLVGQRLREWRPPPPTPVHERQNRPASSAEADGIEGAATAEEAEPGVGGTD